MANRPLRQLVKFAAPLCSGLEVNSVLKILTKGTPASQDSFCLEAQLS